MKKILVSTDFSNNSKSAIRFAIHWATMQKLELVFIYVLHVTRPAQWTDEYFEKYSETEKKLFLSKMEKFIAAIYKKMNVAPGKYSCTVTSGISADVMINDYCTLNPGIDCVCISTRGAGRFEKFFGTNTGNLITNSVVPVFAIPKVYRVSKMNKVLFASDFFNYDTELQKVIAFALPLKAKIDVLHFTLPDEMLVDEKSIETASRKKYTYGLTVHLEKKDLLHSLIQNLRKQVAAKKPSVVIMFTHRQRTVFQKIFFSSKAEQLSFNLTAPLLVFKKG